MESKKENVRKKQLEQQTQQQQDEVYSPHSFLHNAKWHGSVVNKLFEPP